MTQFEYPLNPDWTTEEIIAVVDFLSGVEAVYQSGVKLNSLWPRYQAFKQIVTSIGEEKRLDRAFQSASGYSIYQVVRQMKSLKDSSANNPVVRINIGGSNGRF